MDQLLLLPNASSSVASSIVDVELTENSGVVGLEKTTPAVVSTQGGGVNKAGSKAAAVVLNPNHPSTSTTTTTTTAASADVLDFDSDTAAAALPPALKKLKLKDDDNSSFAFQNPTKQCLSRIHNDLTKLYKDPVEGIFVVPDDRDRANVCHAIVLGPQDTPYEFGFFYFLMEFPNQYPHEPPRVTLQTTGGGTVRFNPNLYRCGKVCLSILGTWNGPSWTPALTIGSVLLSIQSLMNATPYHNEPGFETLHKGGKQPQQYNCIIRHETIRVAVIGMVELAMKTLHQKQLQEQQPSTKTSTTLNNNFVVPGRIPSRLLPEKFAQLVLETFTATGECCQYICDDYKTRCDGKPFQDPYKRNKGTFRFGKLQSKLKDLLFQQQQQTEQQQVGMEEG